MNKTAAAAVLVVLAAVALAARLELRAHDATVAQAARSAQQAATAQAALARTQQAQALADTLTVRLIRAEQDLATTAKERDEALHKATSGRACLGSAALRVLHGAPGVRVAALPTPAAGPAAAHGPAAADTGATPAAGPDPDPGPELETTDTQLGAWVLTAGAQYETCRARLDALIDYALGTAPAHAAAHGAAAP